MKNKTKFIWTAKIGEKGQIVIPKEARDLFELEKGDTILLLGDLDRGIAIVKQEEYLDFAHKILNSVGDDK